jgi:hypothetical protein
MAVRDERGAGRRRAALGRARSLGLATALFLAAGVVATWPALGDADHEFLARPGPAYGGAAPGDHLQTTYNLWLVGHQLERGASPWRDPYSSRPEAGPRPNLQGWLLGLPFWPLERAFGPVVAWNAVVLLGFVLAGALTAAWLGALALPAGAALAGGLAFALAPYRVAQSTGHLLGLVAFLLPLTLLALERRRLALAAAALVAIPLSGQVHLALGAVPLFVAYAAVRTRERRTLVLAAAGALAAVVAGFLVVELVIRDSIAGEGRSLREVATYSAEAGDLLDRELDDGLERFVFLGWATPLLALAGLTLLLRGRRRGLALLLGLAVLLPVVLALGTNTPLYELLRAVLPPLRFPRVPERLMPVACLALAALVAFAAARLRRRAALAALLLLLAVDLRVDVVRAVPADEDNRAYAALAGAPPGRLLELPVFGPQEHYGAVYEYYSMQAPRERPAGYSTTAPPAAARTLRTLRPLGCGSWTPQRERLLRRLGVRYVAVHRGLYAATPYVGSVCAPRARRALLAHGFRPLAQDGAVALYALSPRAGDRDG